ncbi:MAG: tripartite tricarboxylate transporter permease [Candidatus Micrarchaeota archaeon]
MDVLAFAYGLLLGVTGLIPFVHVNTLLDLIPLAPNAVFIVALSFSHLVFETIPAVFFGVPSASQSVSVLPAHEMLLKGQAGTAFKLISSALLKAILFSFFLLPLAWLVLPLAFDVVKPLTAVVLLFLLAAFFYSDSSKGRFFGFVVFALSGTLGFLVFKFVLVPNSLFPLLAGLFGVPALLVSGKGKLKLDFEGESASADSLLVFYGCLLGCFSVLLPAVTPALLSAVVFLFMENDSKRFLQLSSAVVGSKLFFDFVGVAVIGKARSGAAAFFQQSISSISLLELAVLLASGLLAFSLALLALAAALPLLKKMLSSLDFGLLNSVILLLVACGVFFSSGALGLLVLAAASCIGLTALYSGCRRSYATGALILPALLYYLGAA